MCVCVCVCVCVGRCLHSSISPADLMPMTHAPETGARKLASVFGTSVIQSGAEFFWRQILESDRTVFYFATESGDHVIKILICDWSVIIVVAVFVCWNYKFCLCFRLLNLFNLFNLFSLFNMSWTDSEMESLITFYSSMLVSGACVIGIRTDRMNALKREICANLTRCNQCA